MDMLSDIEIARAAKLKPIAEIAARIGIPASALYPYGPSIAKLDPSFLESLADRPDGKLIHSGQSVEEIAEVVRRVLP